MVKTFLVLNPADVVKSTPEDNGRTQKGVQFLRIGHDYKESSTRGGRNPSRRDTAEGTHRCDGTIQCTVAISVGLLHCVDKPVHKICVLDTLKAKNEAVAILKIFRDAKNVETPKSHNRNMKRIFSESNCRRTDYTHDF